MRALILFIIVGLLAGCQSSSHLAPVEELKWRSYSQTGPTHQVKPGETLYAISFRYDRDYRKIAALNNIHYPYAVHTGQIIRLNTAGMHSADPYVKPKKQTIYKSRPVTKSLPVAHRSTISDHHKTVTSLNGWIWPVQGRLAATFSPDQGRKGIDIAGKKGLPIHAVANGVVAYAGNGLKGYGNLIIIKHNNQLLTAYGNNLQNNVREGQSVKKGQVIAQMGIVNNAFWGLHFEIRKQGHPINPLTYLPHY